MSETSNKIFASIVSYGDLDIVPTVRDLLQKASHPENIFVVVFRQSTPDHDISAIRYLDNVLVIDCLYSKSKGVVWAHSNIVPSLDPGFKYWLMVDSHTRFDEGWDDLCIQNLQELPPKSLISVYAPQYFLSREEKSKGYQVNYAHELNPDGSVHWGAKLVEDGHNIEAFKNSSIAGGLMFSPIELMDEVPIDPYLNYQLQETDHTIRAFTYGWNIYAPKFDGAIYHIYERTTRMCPNGNDGGRGLNPVKRYHYKLGILGREDLNDNDVFRLDQYGLGTVRTVKEFEETYNIKLYTREEVLSKQGEPVTPYVGTLSPQISDSTPTETTVTPTSTQKIISIPVAVFNEHFRFQLDLFWYHHKRLYGDDAQNMCHAIVLSRNHYTDMPAADITPWSNTTPHFKDLPHSMCKAYFDYNPEWFQKNLMQTNIQIGLKQIIDKFNDDDVVEILDCDMFHMEKRPPLDVKDDEVYVATDYEKWHLHSKTINKFVIDRYLHKTGGDYNGGFVPIICNIRTLKKIMTEWLAVNLDIIEQPITDGLKWWSSMFAIQASCEKNNVKMIEYNKCYIHGINQWNDEMYICHYSCDGQYIHKNDKEYLYSYENYLRCRDSNFKYAQLFAEWYAQSNFWNKDKQEGWEK